MSVRTYIDKTSRNYKQFIADLPRGKEMVGKIVDLLALQPRLTGDLQATNAAGSGGADEVYNVILGEAGAAATVIKGYVRNKFENGAGATFPSFVSVQFGYVIPGGAFVAVTANTDLTGIDEYLEIDPTVTAIIPATARFGARVTVPAAVTVALGLDLDVQR